MPVPNADLALLQSHSVKPSGSEAQAPEFLRSLLSKSYKLCLGLFYSQVQQDHM